MENEIAQINKPFHEKLVSIEDWDFSKYAKINSPRSIEAIKRCGIDIKDLITISFKEFLEKSIEIRSLPKDLQKKRFEFLETLRYNKIVLIKNERNNIIFEKKHAKTDSFGKSTEKLSNYVSQKSTSLEQLSIDKVKKKQEDELLKLIRKEIQNEIKSTKNHEKLRNKREKEEKMRIEKELKLKEDMKLEREKELKKFEEYKKKEKSLINNDKLKFHEEIQKANQEEIKRTSMIYNINFGESRAEKIQKHSLNLKYLEEVDLKKRGEIMQRQAEKDKIKEVIFERISKEKKGTKLMKKNSLRKLVIERNKEFELKRVNEFYEKQSEIIKRKEKIQNTTLIMKNNKFKRLLERDKKIKDIQKNNENIQTMKKNQVLEKITKNEEKKLKLSKMRERLQMEKSETTNFQKISKQENRKKINKIQEFLIEKTHEKIVEKDIKLKQFIEEKNLANNKLREASNEMRLKKEDFLDKLSKILQNKSIDELSLKSLEEMYKDNSEITEALEKLRECKLINSNNKSIQLGSQQIENSFNKYDSLTEIKKTRTSFKKMPDIDPQLLLKDSKINTISGNHLKNNENCFPVNSIQRKVDEYRMVLNKELLQLINAERRKESWRENELNNIEDKVEKERLEKEFNIERGISSNTIINFNNEMNEKIASFEEKLWKNAIS